MKAVEFDEVNLRIAEEQEEYQTLPAHVNPKEGSITCCFELSDEEKAEIAKTGKVWLKVYTFMKPLQPIYPTVDKSEVIWF